VPCQAVAMASRGVGTGKVVSDMDEHGEMKSDAFSFAKEALDSSETKEEKDVSAHIKRKFDKKYGPTWHCIVGSDFKAHVSHESKHFIFFYIGKTAICLFKSG